MYQAHARVASEYRTTGHKEERTPGGTVAYLLALPVLVAVMAVPAVAVGAAVGVAGVGAGRRVGRRLRRRRGESTRSPSAVTAQRSGVTVSPQRGQ